ncbi:MAG: nucleotidyltransferase domain-containing protein [Gammaproteobacteria bacterium]
MNNDEQLLKIVQDIEAKHGCHTVILYGSRARGESTNTSDFDIIGIREQGDLVRDCRIFEGFYLDAFVYSEEAVKNPDISLIRIKDGIVLIQKEHIGEALLNKIKNIYQQGAPKTAAWEKNEIITWTQKMLLRSGENDIEGNFRRHWLLHDLLECYFKMRDSWYLGPKRSFQWLKANDAVTYSAFETALKPNSSFEEIENLIGKVTSIKS